MVYKLNIRYGIVLLILGLMFFFGVSRVMYYAKYALDTTASVITYPFLRVQQTIAGSLENLIRHHCTIKDLEKQVEKLGSEHQKLLADTIELQSQLNYMQETQELIRFQKRYKTYTNNLVQVLLRQFFDKGHFFIVDAGSHQGIEPDMIAVYKNCLIGKVTEVFPYYSKVVLITDQSFKVAAFCAETKTKGIFEGMNQADVAALTHVSHLEKIHKDDLVISSGEGLVFPRGFGLGRVRYFSITGVDYTIRLEPLIDLKSLSYCYLMKKGQEQE